MDGANGGTSPAGLEVKGAPSQGRPGWDATGRVGNVLAQIITGFLHAVFRCGEAREYDAGYTVRQAPDVVTLPGDPQQAPLPGPSPYPGQRVVTVSLKFIGVVLRVGSDGSFQVQQEYGAALWLRGDCIYLSAGNRLTLVCEREGLENYVCAPPAGAIDEAAG
ncbi:MAG: hypothetical protein HYX53_03420 [Chloroflexi bacterium]|nr:hypothetical protein [Chloroflexota bacterium]